MRRWTWTLLLAALTAWSAPACNQGTNTEEENFIVPPGKADDFYSMSAQEYVVEGVSTVTLESSYADADEDSKMARVKELIGYKHIVIEWFLNQYLIDKSEHDANKDYGGFKAIVKAGAYEDLDIQQVDDLTYSFKFQTLVGGAHDLLDSLPAQDTGDGKKRFTLTMGRVSNSEMDDLETNFAWYRDAPWSDFDPSKLSPEQLETIDLLIWPETRSTDAWIDYNSLYADGVVTISIYFGWDYHDEYHLKHSKTVYNWLVDRLHFTSPVDSYDDYTRTSGPLTKTFKANGKEIEARIWLHWGKPGTDTDPDTNSGGRTLENDMREDLETKEVIIYSGHSGFMYGFALANWRKTYEGDLDDSEIPELDMPSDTYQIVVAEGCDTYALGEAFWHNPNKAGHHNLDVITTTSFSNATNPGIVQDMITALVPQWGDEIEPVTWGDLLQDMDQNSWWFTTMYGVHGIDDNPKLHPFADITKLCQTCSKTSECGAVGNQCTKLNSDEKVCTAFCTDDSGCPDGYKCLASARADGYIHSKQCVPASLSCKQPEPTGPAIIINEVLADPAPDLEGDANGDGVRSYKEDEFVELVNISDKAVDLTGYTVSDAIRVRFTFPEGTTIPAHGVVVVFGGGDSSKFQVAGSPAIFVATEGLALTNSGDSVVLADNYGNEVDRMSYGSEGGRNRSLTRATDGDPEASFILHPDSGMSPGTKQDGSIF